jgi:hypothetical protein
MDMELRHIRVLDHVEEGVYIRILAELVLLPHWGAGELTMATFLPN